MYLIQVNVLDLATDQYMYIFGLFLVCFVTYAIFWRYVYTKREQSAISGGAWSEGDVGGCLVWGLWVGTSSPAMSRAEQNRTDRTN